METNLRYVDFSLLNLPMIARMGQSVGTIGYKVDIPRAGLIFKGCVNSDWEVIVIVICFPQVFIVRRKLETSQFECFKHLRGEKKN